MQYMSFSTPTSDVDGIDIEATIRSLERSQGLGTSRRLLSPIDTLSVPSFPFVDFPKAPSGKGILERDVATCVSGGSG